MNKLTAIRIKNDDNTYSDQIPVSVLAENVQWDNTHSLIDIIGEIDVNAIGNIQEQINNILNRLQTDTSLSISGKFADAKATGDAINNLRGAVGSPLVAATAASVLESFNANGIHVIEYTINTNEMAIDIENHDCTIGGMTDYAIDIAETIRQHLFT